MSVDAFFAYARERHSTYLRRAAGLPRGQWTSDPILQQYRFCNVFRELDRTTIWFRQNVRDPLRGSPDVLLATVLFRWFNRIATGEAIFLQEGLFNQEFASAWDQPKDRNFVRTLHQAITAYCRGGPYVTGSYIIKTPDGMSKLDGVLWCVEQFMKQEHLHFDQCSTQREVAQYLLDHRGEVSLHDVWSWLREYPYMGDFCAYEVVADLRHTALLDRAPDIMTWANPGPGAMRGLNRIHGRPLDRKVSKERACTEMQELLMHSLNCQFWPNVASSGPNEVPGDFTDWPAWEMREVEHTLCEMDKYLRVKNGEGRPRQIFR